MAPFIKNIPKHLLIGLAVSLSLSSAASSHADTSNAISVTRLGIPVSKVDLAEESNPTQLQNKPLVEVNDQPIWAAIENGQWQLAANLLSQTQTNFPNWTPSKNLTLTLRSGQHDHQIKSMVRAQDWQGILSATADTKHCLSEGDHWARTLALASHQSSNKLAEYQISALDHCNTPSRQIKILESATQFLDLADLMAIRSRFKGKALTPDSVNAWVNLEKTIKNKQFDAFFTDQKWQNALSLADETHNASMYNQIGWAVLAENPVLAHKAFTASLSIEKDINILYAQALSAFNMGDISYALNINPTPDIIQSEKWSALRANAQLKLSQTSLSEENWQTAIDYANAAIDISEKSTPDAQAIIGSAWLGMAQKAYENKDYAQAETLAFQAAQNGAPLRDAKMREAWSQYHLKKLDLAEANFAALYLDQQDEESSQGLYFAASANQHLDNLETLSSLVGGPLAEKVKASKAESAFARNDFSTALKLNDKFEKDLAGIDNLWIAQAISMRRTNGVEGANRLSATHTRTSIGNTFNTNILEAGIATISTDAGRAKLTANVGTPNFANDSGKELGVSPFLSWQREGETQFAALITTTPINENTSTRLVGELSLHRRKAREDFRIKASLFSIPRDDSLTSLLGRKDPASTIAYGRIVESGLKGQIAKTFKEQFTVTTAANISELSGQNTIDNTHLGASLAATTSIQHQSFDYIAAGPFYGFDTYEKNSNHHTIGHGGYFSPQQHHRAGISLHAQTREARQTIVRVNASTAYESVKTDPSLVLPLNGPDGDEFSGSSNTGFAVSADVIAMHRLNDKWSIGAAASVISSNAFQDVRAGITLRFTPKGRASMTSRDFKFDPLNRDIW
ncbi:cellulose synthase subunit BcsC-related outer membrane protein [Hirschia litorea]|uniref:Cellulose synthase subunit BcsC-related outer membrane protein n=1 Tax=Hirschia litorea TaxID=1199156 RepID=A0ABW2IMT5_9PROT